MSRRGNCYDKRAANCLGTIYLAASMLWMK